jgi:hypothetical protein
VGTGSGTRDAVFAHMVSKKTVNKVIQGVIAALPAIPYITKKKTSSMVLPMVLGGIGVALLGGVAALMFFSPRTRYRALDIAKDAYGKVNDRIAHIKDDAEQPLSNGLVGDHASGNYTTSGL